MATHDLSILKFLLRKKIKLKDYTKHDVLRYKSGDIVYANFIVDKIPVDINVSWLNPEKIRKIIIISNKNMILFDEMSKDKPIQIFNNFAN